MLRSWTASIELHADRLLSRCKTKVFSELQPEALSNACNAVASGNLIVGSWDKLTIATWNGGIELMVNPFGDPVTAPNNFKMGIVGVRCFCSLDVGLSYPSAFTVAGTVT